MNSYTVSALIAFILLGMGIVAALLGTINYLENKNSNKGRQMFFACWSVFIWNFGYAWMSMCYDDDFAYAARAIALLSIAFFMYFTLKYMSFVAKFYSKISTSVTIFAALIYVVAWTQIIQKNTVSFQRTPWGYWYTSSMNWGRGLQFVSIAIILIQYYYILNYAKKNAVNKRERFVLMHFTWFGPILMLGYSLDALVPMIFKTTAVPGSCIAAFFAAMLFYRVSKQNKTFGLSIANVSEYVFKDVTIPVIITDERDEIILFNDFAPQYLECDAKEISGYKMDKFFALEENSDYRVFNTDKICKFDKTRVNDRFDDMLYTIFFVQDITEEKRNVLLLNESREMAEAANRAKSDFLANMSHEIRTPLNAVLGIDEMIIRESENDTIIEYANNIKQAGNMLLSLINDILDFSKIESGKMEINPVEFSTVDVIRDILLVTKKRAQSKGIELLYEMDERMPGRLIGDDVRIKQILINILTNSIKYTNEGSVSVKFSVVSINDSRIRLNISVLDTGIGIKEEDLKNLFNAFERVDVKKNRNIEGTGLGLSITDRLLGLMGPKLCVESEYGVGSKFYFTLDLEIADALPIGKMSVANIEKNVREKTSAVDFIAPEANILIVDDNKVNLKVAAGLLKRTYVKVTTALSGMESIDLVQNNKYDIIFMDHMMPQMDGIETVEMIKQLGDIPSKDAAIIALTANAVSGAKEMFIKNGFDDFIAKPIKVKELEDKLLSYLPKDKVQFLNDQEKE